MVSGQKKEKSLKKIENIFGSRHKTLCKMFSQKEDLKKVSSDFFSKA
jgi:hypothetical protein